MEILKSYSALKQERAAITGKTAFVPTMGALHDGHLALVKEAKKYADNVIVSIFVNPTQFGKNEDFGKYPRNIESDIAKLTPHPFPPPQGGRVREGADFLYLPQIEDIYPDGEKISVKAGKNAEGLDGDFRTGHFDGVCTVVSILFDQVQPDFAIFGEKDYQQLMVIREMCEQQTETSELKTKSRSQFTVHSSPTIIGVPTLREADGLAMSSRNVYLSAEERKLAPMIYKELCVVRDALRVDNKAISKAQDALTQHGFKLQYLEQRWNRLLIAAYLGNTRLIDNIALD